MEQLYRIEELETTGWVEIDTKYCGLTKDQAKESAQRLIEDGYNPNHLRIVIDNESDF